MTGEGGQADASDVIADEAVLLRIVSRMFFVDDGAGGKRLASGTFRSRDLSVVVEDRLNSLGFSVADIPLQKGYGLAAITAGLVRKVGLRVVYTPEDGEGVIGQAHATILGNPTEASISKLVAGAIVRAWPPPEANP